VQNQPYLALSMGMATAWLVLEAIPMAQGTGTLDVTLA
jgi:hypothetical protein